MIRDAVEVTPEAVPVAAAAPGSRVVLIGNPHAQNGAVREGWQRVAARVRSAVGTCGVMETAGDGRNVERMIDVVRATRPALLIAAGGDGTVSEVVQAIMVADVPEPPALAIIPLGTANNVARSFGLRRCRAKAADDLDLALATALGGAERRIDLGRVGARYFVGSFALGMDADILALRNRVQRRLGVGGWVSGYPLYLWSCAANVLGRHGGTACLRIDGRQLRCRAYNILVTNTPIYAGEFRFDGHNSVDDGTLDLHVFDGALEYLVRYPAAWRRHVRHSRGLPCAVPATLQRVREVIIELDAAVSWQVDGEEYEAATAYQIRVAPGALRVKVPDLSSDLERQTRS